MKIKIAYITLLVFGVGLSACLKNVAQEPGTLNCATVNAKYGADITPIINAKCASSGCHNGSAPGNFTSYAGIKTYIDNGKVKDRVFVKKDMPVAGLPQLTEDEKNSLQCWLDNGAPNN